jgi:hypothetical protein
MLNDKDIKTLQKVSEYLQHQSAYLYGELQSIIEREERIICF